MECLKYYIDTLLKINVFKLDVISNKIEEFKNNFMSIFKKSKMPKPNNNLTYFNYVKQQILEVDEDNEVQNEEELSEDENKKDKDKKNLKKKYKTK